MRHLNIHEYQGAQLLEKYGVNVPPGIACNTIEEVKTATAKLAGASGEVVLKSQVLAGGRGLGTFKNGFKGGVHIVKVRGQRRASAPRPLPAAVAPKVVAALFCSCIQARALQLAAAPYTMPQPVSAVIFRAGGGCAGDC